LRDLILEMNYTIAISLIVIALTTIGAIMHKSFWAVFYGWVIGGILIFYNELLEPIIFGWVSVTDPYLWTITISLFGIWIITIIVNVINILKRGVPVL
jgi:hypothetical protein